MKALSKSSISIRPFLTHKRQAYNFSVGDASNPAVINFDTAASYDYIANTMSLAAGHAYVFGEPFQFGDPLASNNPIDDENHAYIGILASLNQLFYAKRGLNAGIDRGYTLAPLNYVINFAQTTYGEQIQPGSFVMQDLVYTGSIVDDGKGHLMVSGSTAVIGNLFYKQGIAVIQGRDQPPFASQSIYSDGITYETGSAYSFSYNACHTIYEHSYICTMDEGDFNYSFNPSLTSATSSVSGAVSVLDSFASGTLTPYMSTVGLYTSAGELVAVAKFPRPLKRASESQQSIIIRFDV